jgi:7-cyano-7-deazaguanine synthase in queuosine biosynthesis
MRHHSIICRLGGQDRTQVTPSRVDSTVTEVSFIDGNRRLGFGLGQALDQLQEMGLRPAERAVDLALLAATLTAADTRISRDIESQDGWTREIDLHLPVAEPTVWTPLSPLLTLMLNFLTGDRWGIRFRPRPPGLATLTVPANKLRAAYPSCVCLFSGGLDSFIGTIDLVGAGQDPLLVSHYWDGITSSHQRYCLDALRKRYQATRLDHVTARVGFPSDLVDGSAVENTLRGRSFLFFGLATLAASSLGDNVVVHVPENGLISLNVPLDPMRLGANSTRTTHPFYMARFNELLHGLGISARLENSYRHQTKGQMVEGCVDKEFLRRLAKNTMSCSSPAKNRYAPDEAMRKPQHCGYCVPCLIRRASLLAGFGADDTTYSIPDLRARVLDTNKAEGVHVRSFDIALMRLATKAQRARFDIHRAGPLTDHPGDFAAYERVYVDGMREVGNLLVGVRARPS